MMRFVLHDIALISAFLDYSKPVLVILAGVPWGSHNKLKAYPFDMRDQFEFIGDLTVRDKLGVRDAGAREVQAPAMIQTPQSG